MKLNLHFDLIKLNLEDNTLNSSRTQSAGFVGNKRKVPKEVLESCLDTLDLFRDLLEGYP